MIFIHCVSLEKMQVTRLSEDLWQERLEDEKFVQMLVLDQHISYFDLRLIPDTLNCNP